MSDFVENSVESFIDELQSALKNNPKPINIKALKNWEPSGLTTALLRKVQGYATGMKRRSTFVKSQKIVWLEGGNPHGEPVLLLHGFASSKENWVLLTAVLKLDGIGCLCRIYRVGVRVSLTMLSNIA